MSEIKVNVQELTGLLSCAKLYMNEATLRIADGYAQVTEVDATHVQMISGKIECDCEPCNIPVNLEKLIKAISAAGKDAVMELDNDRIILHGEHARIKVPLIYRDVNFKWPPKFDADPVAECEISPSLLSPVISYGVYTNSSFARFSIKDTRMTVEIGTESDVSEVISPSTAVGESTVNIDLAYLDALIKYVKNVPSIKVCGFGSDTPLMFKWNDGTGVYRVVIAPRIED